MTLFSFTVAPNVFSIFSFPQISLSHSHNIHSRKYINYDCALIIRIRHIARVFSRYSRS